MGRLDDLSPREWDLVHTSYAHALESLQRNEEMGERRFELLLAVASAAGVAVGLVADVSEPRATFWAGTGVAIVLSILGALTVIRLARRNLTTTQLIERLTRLRTQAMTEDSTLRALMIYDPYVDRPPPRVQGWAPTKGGLVDLVGCTTALFAGTAALLAGMALSLPVVVVVLGASATAVAAWLAQVSFIKTIYAEKPPDGR